MAGFPLGLFFGIMVAVLAGWVGLEMFGWTTGKNIDGNETSAAGAWASAIGATALAIASVWLAVQANRQARKAEETAEIEAGKAEARHKDAIDAAERRMKSQFGAAAAQHDADTKIAEQRHALELSQANERLERQIEVEWQREQIRAIAAIWDAMTKFIEPTNELRRRVEECALEGAVERKQALVNTYANWKFLMFEMRSTFTPADMMVDGQSLRKQLEAMKFKLLQLETLAKDIKDAALDNGVASRGRQFTLDLNEILQMREPMTREVRSVLRAKLGSLPAPGGTPDTAARASTE